MKIVEPIAMKNNKVYELTVYPYKTSLKKGQLVTLFLEKIANGDFSIKLFGNAQINPQLESSYSAPLDLYLNSDEKTSDLIGSLYLAGGIDVARDKAKSIDLTTPSKTYNIHYLELVETNQLFVIIDNVGYFTSLDKTFE